MKFLMDYDNIPGKGPLMLFKDNGDGTSSLATLEDVDRAIKEALTSLASEKDAKLKDLAKQLISKNNENSDLILQISEKAKQILELKSDNQLVTVERDTEIKRAREAERQIFDLRQELKGFEGLHETKDLLQKFYKVKSELARLSNNQALERYLAAERCVEALKGHTDCAGEQGEWSEEAREALQSWEKAKESK